MKAIVITGNPVDGSFFTGPFEDASAAVRWAERECNDEWWVADLTAPEEVL